MIMNTLNVLTLLLFGFILVVLGYDVQAAASMSEWTILICRFLLLIALARLAVYLTLTRIAIPMSLQAFKKHTMKMILEMNEE